MAEEINYLVDDATADQFQNITTFVKNMVIKDSELYESAETDVSRWFGNMLLKYYNSELSNEDIDNLVQFVIDYNKMIDEQLENSVSLLKIYGLYKTQDFSKSILNIIVESYISDNSYTETTYSNHFELEKEKIKSIIFKKFFDDITKTEDFNKNNLNFDYNESVSYMSNYNDVQVSLSNIFNIEDGGFKNNIESLKTAFRDKEKIPLINIKYISDKEKRSANETEKSLVCNGNLLNFIDIIVDNSDINNDLGDRLNQLDAKINTKNTTDSSKSGNVNNELLNIIYYTDYYRDAKDGNIEYKKDEDNKTSYKTEFVIFYKELNPEYRNTLDISNIELNLFNNGIGGQLANIEKTIIKNIDSNNNALDISCFNSIRSISTSEFLARDFKSSLNEKEILKTSQLFRNMYTNPYIARNAAESEIIVYYMGDSYISNNYGEYNYQKEEIYEFLKIYQETRDYYYRVLANESFTKEDQYKLYEKAFLSFWSIERFISGKLDNLKNVDSYNLTDITNFFETYGFADLAKMINDKDFYDPALESYSKNLIRSYIDLIQNKGSKSVIQKIEDAFSIDRQSLSIFRNFLYNRQKNNVAISSDDILKIFPEKFYIKNGNRYNRHITKEDENGKVNINSEIPEGDICYDNVINIKCENVEIIFVDKDGEEKTKYININQQFLIDNKLIRLTDVEKEKATYKCEFNNENNDITSLTLGEIENKSPKSYILIKDDKPVAYTDITFNFEFHKLTEINKISIYMKKIEDKEGTSFKDEKDYYINNETKIINNINEKNVSNEYKYKLLKLELENNNFKWNDATDLLENWPENANGSYILVNNNTDDTLSIIGYTDSNYNYIFHSLSESLPSINLKTGFSIATEKNEKVLKPSNTLNTNIFGKIYDNVLCDNISYTGNLSNGLYEFTKINDNDDWNPISTINRATAPTSLKDTVEKDKYWDYSDTDDDFLHGLKLETSNTKYIIPQIVNELSSSYVYARVSLAIIKYLGDKLKDKIDFGNIEKPDDFTENPFENSSNNRTIESYINTIAYCFQQYLKTLINKDPTNLYKYDYDGNNYKTFSINISEFSNKYRKFYTENYKVDESYIRKRFSITDKNKDENYVDTIKKILEPYKILILINSKITTDKDGKISNTLTENDIKTLFGTTSNNRVYFSEVLNDLIELPISIIDGDFEDGNLTNNAGLPHNIKDFIMTLYEDIYFKKDENDILYANSDILLNNPSYDSNGWKNLLIDSLVSLKEITTELLNLNLYTSIGSIIEFLSAVIDYFISYTTQIYSFEYISSYENKSETIAPSDCCYLTKGIINEQDSFFYDESLTIEEII